jgi:hypothetical protein
MVGYAEFENMLGFKKQDVPNTWRALNISPVNGWMFAI